MCNDSLRNRYNCVNVRQCNEGRQLSSPVERGKPIAERREAIVFRLVPELNERRLPRYIDK